jgi:segregation and condensation protein A
MSEAADALLLDLGQWEGPLDLLLDLARRQKVDLARISVLELVDQYLAVVRSPHAPRLELAAEWLVMAAWLVDLKSRLLLPPPPPEEPRPEAEAALLRHRLARLEAMREAAARLAARPRLGRDTFARGAPEGLRLARRIEPQASLAQLLAAYAAVRARRETAAHRVRPRPVVGIEAATERLRRVLGRAADWVELTRLLPLLAPAPELRRSAAASGLVAALELARTGAAELRQRAAFAAVELRGAGGAAASAGEAGLAAPADNPSAPASPPGQP